jgi:hypothetical protein
MHESFEPDSNVTLERDEHREKHRISSVPTEEGMQIDESDEHFRNAEPEIYESFEPDSNVTLESEEHP